MNKILLLIGGIINLVFAVFHLALGKLLNWNETLSPLSLDNRATVYVLNIHVAFTLLIFAYLSFFHRQDLLTTQLGQVMAITISLFWILRAINQLIFYGLTAPDTPFWFVVCLIIGLLYLIPVIMERKALG